MLFATVVQATVPSRASLIEPPTCWPVLSRLAAAPAVEAWTLDRATTDSGMNSMPSPAPATSVGPSSPVVSWLFSLIRDSQNIPPAADDGIKPRPVSVQRARQRRGRQPVASAKRRLLTRSPSRHTLYTPL